MRCAPPSRTETSWTVSITVDVGARGSTDCGTRCREVTPGGAALCFRELRSCGARRQRRHAVRSGHAPNCVDSLSADEDVSDAGVSCLPLDEMLLRCVHLCKSVGVGSSYLAGVNRNRGTALLSVCAAARDDQCIHAAAGSRTLISSNVFHFIFATASSLLHARGTASSCLCLRSAPDMSLRVTRTLPIRQAWAQLYIRASEPSLVRHQAPAHYLTTPAHGLAPHLLGEIP